MFFGSKKNDDKVEICNFLLYNENYVLLLEENNVIVDHIDRKIYDIYDNNNNFLKRVDVGNNMLIIMEKPIKG